MYVVDFERLQRLGDGPYYNSLKKIKNQYANDLRAMNAGTMNDFYRDQLIAYLTAVEMEIDHIDEMESELYA